MMGLMSRKKRKDAERSSASGDGIDAV